MNRIRQPDKTVLLAVPLEIDFGDKAGLTASHRAFLCATQDRGYSTKASWSRGASDPVVDAFGGSSPATVAINRAQALNISSRGTVLASGWRPAPGMAARR